MSVQLAILETVEGAMSVVTNADGTFTVYDKDGLPLAYNKDEVLAAAKDIDAREKLKTLRFWRDEKLKDTDWVVVKAQELGEPVPQEWLAYRQALRDITDTYSCFEDAVWPIKPQ